MEKHKAMSRFWFNHRALYRQWPFWGGLVLTLLPLMFAAWRILSPYQFDTSPGSVLFFFQQLEPLIPWFAAVIAVAALLARMHATVQTEAQIDEAGRHAVFGNYLQHRKYFNDAVSEIPSLQDRALDLSHLYKCLFPDNGPKRFFPSATDQSESYLGKLDENLMINFDRALNKNRTEGATVWPFDFQGYWLGLSGCFPAASIGLLNEEREESARHLAHNTWDDQGVAWLDHKTDLIHDLLDRLTYIADTTRAAHARLLPFAFMHIHGADGMVVRDEWQPANFTVRGYQPKNE